MSGSYGAIDSASWSDYAAVLEHTQKRAGGAALGPRPVPGCSSCRWMVAYVCFAGSVVTLALMQDMSMALVCMFPRIPEFPNTSVTWTELSHSNDTPAQAESLNWTEEVQGLLLSAHFYGSLISPVLAGYLSTRYGGKVVLVVSTAVGVVCTMLTPPSSWASPWLVFTLRVVLGFALGMYNPAVQALLSVWSPVYDRTKMIAFSFSGANVGNILSYSITGLVCEIPFAGGWPLIFYILGGAAVVWIAWVMLCIYNSPDQHPRISEIERHYITSGMTTSDKKALQPTRLPWLPMLRSLPLWVIAICQMVNVFCQLVQQLNVPMYMRDVLVFSVEQNGLLSSLPALGRLIGAIICGVASDLFVRKKLFTLSTTRKVFFFVGFVLPAGSLFGLGYLGSEHREYAVVLLVIAGTTSSAGMIVIRVNLMDIAPRYASILLGVLMTLNGLVGVVSPVIVTMLTAKGTRAEWQVVFSLCSGMYVFGAVIFLLFGSSQEQWWSVAGEEGVGLLGEQARGKQFANGYVVKNELTLPDPGDSEGRERYRIKGKTFLATTSAF